jgi:hypothetical protein
LKTRSRTDIGTDDIDEQIQELRSKMKGVIIRRKSSILTTTYEEQGEEISVFEPFDNIEIEPKPKNTKIQEPQTNWLSPKDWRRIDRDRIDRVKEFMKWKHQK